MSLKISPEQLKRWINTSGIVYTKKATLNAQKEPRVHGLQGKYEREAYCGHCGKWRLKSLCGTNKRGALLCPECFRQVREQVASFKRKPKSCSQKKPGCVFCKWFNRCPLGSS